MMRIQRQHLEWIFALSVEIDDKIRMYPQTISINEKKFQLMLC